VAACTPAAQINVVMNDSRSDNRRERALADIGGISLYDISTNLLDFRKKHAKFHMSKAPKQISARAAGDGSGGSKSGNKSAALIFSIF
jgi:hypothetical protein